MLKRIRLKDFKSFVDEEVEVAPLTMLVGANASGKSNFLDAIQFLQGLASGLTLSEVLNGERQSSPDAWPEIRGRAEETARMGKAAFTLESVWLAPKLGPSSEPNTSELLPNQVELRHRIVCQTTPLVLLEGEALESKAGGDEKLSTVGHRIENEIDVEQSLGKVLKVDASQSLLGLLENRRGRFLTESNYGLLAWWRDALHELRLLHVKPSEMRDYGRRNDPLGDHGENLSGVLADLFEKADEKASLIDWLVELCAPEIEDIDF